MIGVFNKWFRNYFIVNIDQKGTSFFSIDISDALYKENIKNVPELINKNVYGDRRNYKQHAYTCILNQDNVGTWLSHMTSFTASASSDVTAPPPDSASTDLAKLESCES